MHFKIHITCSIFRCVFKPGQKYAFHPVLNKMYHEYDVNTNVNLHTSNLTCCSLVRDSCPSVSGALTVGTYTDTKIQRGKAQTFGLSVSTGQACKRMAQKTVTDRSVSQERPRKYSSYARPCLWETLQESGTMKQAQVSAVTGLTRDSAMHDGSWSP